MQNESNDNPRTPSSADVWSPSPSLQSQLYLSKKKKKTTCESVGCVGFCVGYILFDKITIM